MTRIKTIATRDLNRSVQHGVKHKKITEHNQKRRLRRMPDILPVCMQNILRRGKPALRK